MVELELRRESEQQLIKEMKEIKLNREAGASSRQTSGSDHDDNSSGIQADGLSGDLQEIDMNLVNEVRSLLKSEFESDTKGKYSATYYDEIMDPQSAATCWRFIVHRQYDPKDTVELMKQTLEWRKSFQVDELAERADELAKELWLYGPSHWCGIDREGHDIIYVVGKNYRKPTGDFKLYIRRFITYLLYSWDRQHRYDLNKFTAVFDVSDTGYRNVDLDFVTWLLGTRDYIPARINRIYIVGIPFILQPVIRLVISWLPENFKQITRCCSVETMVQESIDPSQMPSESGGQRDDDELYKLAPREAPWAADTEVYSTPTMQKAIHYSISFALEPELQERLTKMQRDFEAGKLAIKTPEKSRNNHSTTTNTAAAAVGAK